MALGSREGGLGGQRWVCPGPQRRFWSLTRCASLGSASPLWFSARGGEWQHLPHGAVERIQQAVLLTALLPVPRMAEGEDAHHTPRA